MIYSAMQYSEMQISGRCLAVETWVVELFCCRVVELLRYLEIWLFCYCLAWLWCYCIEKHNVTSQISIFWACEFDYA